MLTKGDPAPEFRLQSTSGGSVALSDLRGKVVVIYAYPKDDTPGCTREACDFRDNFGRVGAAGAVVLGISKDSLESHRKFRGKYDLPFDLLSDPDAAVLTAYGAFGEKMLYGKVTQGVIRSTFLVDRDGRIARAWSPVKVEGHVDDVLAAIADLPA
jgi:thioredoxin-dependent peroxiredoxin